MHDQFSCRLCLRNKIGKEKEKGRKMERDIEMGDTEIRRRTDTEGSRIVHTQFAALVEEMGINLSRPCRKNSHF